MHAYLIIQPYVRPQAIDLVVVYLSVELVDDYRLLVAVCDSQDVCEPTQLVVVDGLQSRLNKSMCDLLQVIIVYDFRVTLNIIDNHNIVCCFVIEKRYFEFVFHFLFYRHRCSRQDDIATISLRERRRNNA